MSIFVNPFSRSSRAGDAWFCVGSVSSYPNIDECTRVAEHRPCGEKSVPGCRVFHIPRHDSSEATEVAIDDWKDPDMGGDTKDQVMVFQYKGRFVAVNHECPHSSYPLSNGLPFDIEDFGVVLSSGIQCPKHDWSFDLHTGRSDRGNYRLQVWEVQQNLKQGGHGEMEVWVRRKKRNG
ncbi:hypothetical protein BDW02DRAFT_630766 [Decorospora gaudefroyi]|uniref:Rieske domain-containing protein n=1 Tax=Decorospora gaudefroyi TaxID=184978 RepID=A0A6A5KCH8_9PLEO|nr:hypothetical protein BDW02DRAFT_630766 [Decorospora gaudefroyi]